MKTSLSHPHLPSPAAERPSSRPAHPAARSTQHASGVALVVTLIMLSVITFMAIAFLVLSRAEHGSVATETEQTQARLAAETGLQRAIAQALGPMLAQNNEFNYDLLVSTNYINPFGFTNGSKSPLNVNYDFDAATHGPLTVPEQAQNIANLWYDPRPPVFLTNRLSALGGNEFRFFLNLNRNTNAFGPVFDQTGWLAATNNGVLVGTNWFVGDPQWVGILSSPDRPHAGDNRFVSRFAFVAIPAGKTLDHNYIHNQAALALKTPPLQLNPNGGDYLRNQGVGTWEGNLAAFLCDLNTNAWDRLGDYQYNPLGNLPTQGTAFLDACSLIRYRYGCPLTDLTLNRVKLPSFADLYPVNQSVLVRDGIDDYTAGPLMGVTWPLVQDPDATPAPSRANLPWVGANNTNHYFTPQEYFDPSKTSPEFVGRLMTAGNDTTSSYNEYTFYRMLAQLGSDTAGDAGRINLNYCNLDNQGHVVPNMQTNCQPWLPEQFFTNTANALLQTYGYNFTVTNIQIYPTNFYTASVHRLLQLAANIYDASTSSNSFGAYNFPHVFRPFFRQVTFPNNVSGVMIAGYREVQDDSVAFFSPTNGASVQPSVILGYNQDSLPSYVYGQFLDPSDPKERLVTGIPLVIGAKKGFPNFNEFGMDTQVEFGRKLRFMRDAAGNIAATNAMFLLNLTNTFGFEAWNSYTSIYPHTLEVRMDAVLYALLTTASNAPSANNLLRSPGGPGDLTDPVATHIYRPAPSTIPASTWYGYTDPIGQSPTRTSFRAVTQSYTWTNAQYSLVTSALVPLPGMWDSPNISLPPGLYLTLRPLVRFALVDTSVNPHRIIDYVSLDGTTTPTNIMALITSGAHCDGPVPSGSPVNPGSIWCANLYNGVPVGIFNQINVNLGNVDDPLWPKDSHQADVDFFRKQFDLGPLYFPYGTFSKTNTFYTAFCGERPVSYHIRWQANDPLVHYTVPDLVDLLGGKPGLEFDTINYPAMAQVGGLDIFTAQPVGAVTPLNDHYRPWGGNPVNSGDTTLPTNYRLEVKDPLITRSDMWDFPTNKYPNIGWLGRVHRGTPWQTVYLKSTTNTLVAGNQFGTWPLWVGNTSNVTNYNGRGSVALDAAFSMPENDRAMLDLFSAAFNDNAARGRMSVNQQGLAAWSAILSGVVVRTNTTPDATLFSISKWPQLAPANIRPMPQVAPPAGQFDPLLTNSWPPLMRIVNGINRARTILFANHEFNHLGDLLAVPELTVASPFLNQGTINKNITGPDKGKLTYQQTLGLTDADYERIPQQILGLLQCDHTPRFVIYAYGQALKPAEHSVVYGGPFYQLCTNYQVTAEVATRAVVRIDGAPAHPRAVIESFNVLPPD